MADTNSHFILYSQLSPYLEPCCLRASASVSYQRAAEDVKYATGIEVPKSVQQRLVHRQNFELPEVQSTVEELSVDGGNIRIRTPVGKPCDWKGNNQCLSPPVTPAAPHQKISQYFVSIDSHIFRKL